MSSWHRVPVSQKARLPCPEAGSSSSWPHAYSTYAPQLSRIAAFTALRRLRVHTAETMARAVWDMQDNLSQILHTLFRSYRPGQRSQTETSHFAACSGRCLDVQHAGQQSLLYLSVSSAGVPDSGGSLRTSSTWAGVASGASFHPDCTLAAAALRAATSFTAAATAVKFVPGACNVRQSQSHSASERWCTTCGRVTDVSMLRLWHIG